MNSVEWLLIFLIDFASSSISNLGQLFDIHKKTFTLNKMGLYDKLEAFEAGFDDENETTNSKRCDVSDIIEIVRKRRDDDLKDMIDMAGDLEDAVNEDLKRVPTNLTKWPPCCGLNNKVWKDPTNENKLVYMPKQTLDAADEELCQYPPILNNNFDGIAYSSTECFCNVYGKSYGINLVEFSWGKKVLEAFQKNADKLSGKLGGQPHSILQEIGTKYGKLSMFPQNDNGKSFRPCDSIDPRSRPWMKKFMEEVSKFVICIDISDYFWTDYIDGIRINKFVINFIKKIYSELESISKILLISGSEKLEEIENGNEIEKLAENEFELLEAILTKPRKISFTIDSFKGVLARSGEYAGHHIIIISDFKYISNVGTFDGINDHTTFVNVGREIVTLRNRPVLQIRRELMTHNFEDIFQSAIKPQLVTYRKVGAEVRYTEPYYDWGGAGEVISIGYPVFHNEDIYGAVSVKTTLLTSGVGHSPLTDSILFYDGFKSHLIIFDYETMRVFAYENKQMHGNRTQSQQKSFIADYIIEDEKLKMISCVVAWAKTGNPIECEDTCQENTKNGPATYNCEFPNETYYWTKSVVQYITLLYGVMIKGTETGSINRIMSRLEINQCNTYQVQSNYWKSNYTCWNFHTPADEHEEEYLKYYEFIYDYHYFLYSTPQAHNFQMHGDNYDSNAFREYVKEHKECLKGNTCKMLLKPNAYRDICFLAWSQWAANHTFTQEETYIKLAYIGTTGGIFMISSRPSPYGFDPAIRAWYRKAIQMDSYSITLYNDIHWKIPMLGVCNVIKYKHESRLVPCIDITVDVIQQLLGRIDEDCKEENFVFKHVRCFIFDQQGCIIAHTDLFSRTTDLEMFKLRKYEPMFLDKLMIEEDLQVEEKPCQMDGIQKIEILARPASKPLVINKSDYQLKQLELYNFFHVKVTTPRKKRTSVSQGTTAKGILCNPVRKSTMTVGTIHRCEIVCDCELWQNAKSVEEQYGCKRKTKDECNIAAYCHYTNSSCGLLFTEESKKKYAKLQNRCGEKPTFVLKMVWSIVAAILGTGAAMVVLFFVVKGKTRTKHEMNNLAMEQKVKDMQNEPSMDWFDGPTYPQDDGHCILAGGQISHNSCKTYMDWVAPYSIIPNIQYRTLQYRTIIEDALLQVKPNLPKK